MTEEILVKLNDGVTMMLIGMGTVLVFLCVMIVAMNIMSWSVAQINKLFPEVVPQVASSKAKTNSSNDEEIAAAIISAMFGKK